MSELAEFNVPIDTLFYYFIIIKISGKGPNYDESGDKYLQTMKKIKNSVSDRHPANRIAVGDMSVCLSVCLLHAGVASKRHELGSQNLH